MHRIFCEFGKLNEEGALASLTTLFHISAPNIQFNGTLATEVSFRNPYTSLAFLTEDSENDTPPTEELLDLS